MRRLTLLILVAAIEALTTALKWEESSQLKGLQFSPTLFQGIVPNLPMCGVLCHSNTLCRGFTYVRGEGHCQGYTKFTNQTSLNGGQAWKITPSTERCTDVGYSMSGPVCYEESTTPMPWLTAVTECTGIGGRLLMLETQTRLDNFMYNTSSDVWIGITDAVVEDDWRWTDGSDVNFTKWFGKQPNNKDTGYPGLPANCVTTKHGEWHDEYCGNKYQYLCEV